MLRDVHEASITASSVPSDHTFESEDDDDDDDDDYDDDYARQSFIPEKGSLSLEIVRYRETRRVLSLRGTYKRYQYVRRR